MGSKGTKKEKKQNTDVNISVIISMKRTRSSRFAQDSRKDVSTHPLSQTHENFDYLNDDVSHFIVPISRQPKRTKSYTESNMTDVNDQNVRKDSIMKDTLIEGLQSSIPETNKGFQLMVKKFGFKLGTGLGKSETGIKEPIQLNVSACSMALEKERNTKTGIGVVSMQKQRLQNILELQEQLKVSFQTHIRRKYKLLRLLQDIRHAARVLYELELPSGQFTHVLSLRIHSEVEVSSLSIIKSSSDSMRHTTSACGETTGKCVISFLASNRSCVDMPSNDVQEIDDAQKETESAFRCMQQRFLTFLEENQMQLVSIGKDSSDHYLDKCDDHVDLLETLSFVLFDVLHFLRENYYYCLYCGVKYDDDEDMSSNCPGLLDENH